jgi:hypothetical protein
MNQAGKITQPVFADHNQALRFVPRVGWGCGPPGSKTSTWSRPTASCRTPCRNGIYSLFDSTLTYNIDKDGNYAVSGSYRKGRLDETGARVEQIMAGLAIKLNDPPSVTAAP